MAYLCQYRHYFPGDSRHDVMFKISMAEGFAMIGGAMAVDPFLSFCGLKVEGAVKDEIDRGKKKRK